MRRWLAVPVVAASLVASCSTEPSTAIDATASVPDGPDRALATGAPRVATSVIDGQPVGFDMATARLTKPDGTTCDLCVWLANSADRRARGLMFVTDLGVADGMAFLYPEPLTGTFWMKNTPMPLSIAFYADDGRFLSSFDMAPCLQASCGNYATPNDFLIAVEVPQGELDEHNLVSGTSLRLLDLPCEPAA